MTSAEIRQRFLDFFAERGHTVVPSASLVPADDPTLLFTNAGMNQFKDVFLGIGSRDYTRAVDTQKCMRVSGKHNDLEDVGRDTTHHTFFEMLGNWSFGDYYKKEAIGWAWELLTGVLGLPGERLWASVFKDEYGELETDDEALGFWRSETGMDSQHILYFGRKDNFWEMGDTGPCGPCSEIHYDRGPEVCDRQDELGHVCQVNGDCARFTEIWNLVFIQYNKDDEGTLHPLPARHIDTGMGFERLVAILQGVDSNYKTDLFTPIIGRVQEMAGHTDEDVQAHIVSYRVIADHGRAVTFLIGDGVLPGNEGRNYVARMVLRRAARFGRKLGFDEPFLAEVAKVIIERMGHQFPELVNRREFILATITQEEERFLRTLDTGLAQLEQALAELKGREKDVLPGEIAFKLYDTFGLPLEITRDVMVEQGLTVDEAGYQEALETQRQRAREADRFAGQTEEAIERYGEILAELQDLGALLDEGVVHDPYATTDLETVVAAILRDGEMLQSAQVGDQVEVILPETCFYVESGGQVSDRGTIAAYDEVKSEPTWEIEVQDMREPLPGLIVHVGEVKKGEPHVGDEAWAVVDFAHRMDVARNHTATHLLQSELRYVLGEHVQQAGSLVTPDRLRFDFTHPKPLTDEQLREITRSVNETILVNYPVVATEEKYRQAVEDGVIALFGEKYGEDVRVLRIGGPGEPVSRELCGGTHLHETGEIGLFHIVSEESIGAGVRRIEAVTGRKAVELVENQLGTLKQAAAHLGTPPDEVNQKVQALLEELQSARKEIARLAGKLAHREFEGLLDRVETVAGVQLLNARVTAPSMEVLREMTDWFRDRMDSGVIVLGTVLEDRPVFVAAVTPDLVERGVDAGRMVKEVARVVGGGGGGRPTLAQAGGRDAARLDEALQKVPSLLKDMIHDRR
ncbi:MAG TPA: alanine--tRNA ligase [Chloroflexi bacterium]|nr:alanine--tRNA ligase [Chloroflexota bacterium]